MEMFGYNNFSAIVHLIFEWGIVPVMIPGADADDIRESVGIMMNEFEKQIAAGDFDGPPISRDTLVMVILHSDSFAVSEDKPEEMSQEDWNEEVKKQMTSLEKFQDLTAAFNAGHPQVYEALMSVGMLPGYTVMRTNSYRYSEVDGWDWQPPRDYEQGILTDHPDGDGRWDFDNWTAPVEKSSPPIVRFVRGDEDE